MVGARLETRSDGYERWRVWDPVEGRERYVYVHQLLAIAGGADPRQVFSGGAYHIHHKNGIRYDNRPSNISVERTEDHARTTFGHEPPEISDEAVAAAAPEHVERDMDYSRPDGGMK